MSIARSGGRGTIQIHRTMRNFAYRDEFPYEAAGLAELMVLFEDAIDVQKQHFRID